MERFHTRLQTAEYIINKMEDKSEHCVKYSR